MGSLPSLSPGRYRFVLLVNDPKSWEEAMGIVHDPQKGTVRDPQKAKVRDPQKIYLDQMTNDRGMLSSQMLYIKNTRNRTNLYGNDKHPRLIPMTGQAMLTIPKGNDDGTAKTVNPDTPIDLERVFARVELILTTANKEMEYLSPEIAKYKIDNRKYVDGKKSGSRLTKGDFVDLVDTDWRAGTLEMLPSRGEYTATGGDMPEESRLYSDRTSMDYLNLFRDGATYRTQVTTPYADNLDENNVFYNSGSFSPMYHQRSKTRISKFTVNVYYLYIPPMFIDGLKKEDMPYILIGINTTGVDIPEDAPVNAPQMTYFRLPITTLVSAAGGGIEEKFEIRRNTTYSIYAAFRGGKLILEDGIKVLPWKVENETIEVDIDDATTPPVIPIEK